MIGCPSKDESQLVCDAGGKEGKALELFDIKARDSYPVVTR